MPDKITCRDLAALMTSETLYAVFDIRERGEFNARQISQATSLPRSQIESRIADLVPDRKIPMVVYDDDGKRGILAARTLEELGYSKIAVLDGGLPAWEQKGLPMASGVNVPSKTFGERVHDERTIPEVTPEELKDLQERSADLVILDVRTPEEYGRFCIPKGVNVPGGDLILWADALKRKPETTVVVNCAGRTRSIIGTAALMRLGVTNVRGLRNGTMGWVLAGLELELKPRKEAPQAPAASRENATGLAQRIAEEEGIPWIETQQLMGERAGLEQGITYLIDVRSEEEFGSVHIPGSINVPGGQAVQRADDFIAVRNGRIIFISNQAARAVMAAYWYRRMDFRNAQFLQGGLEAWRRSGGSIASGTPRSEPLGYESARKVAHLISPPALSSLLQAPALTILDVGNSLDFQAAHLPGAQWISRGWLELKLPEIFPDKNRSLVLSCRDGQNSIFAARALVETGYKKVFVLDGGVQAWAQAGCPTVSGLEFCLVEPNDVVLSPSVTGDTAAMRRYLEWEVKLSR